VDLSEQEMSERKIACTPDCAPEMHCTMGDDPIERSTVPATSSYGTLSTLDSPMVYRRYSARPRSNRWLDDLSVHIPTMRDLKDRQLPTTVIYQINDPVITLPQTIPIVIAC
jgi:hypothetical protein